MSIESILNALVTLVIGSAAFILYFRQKWDNKRDAAKIILQEIRRAEDIISDYKENGQYKFTKRIIATNSWAKNIHHFVGDLDQDELDKISNLYSMGEYLDSIIAKISDIKFFRNIELAESIAQSKIQQLNVQNLPSVSAQVQNSSLQILKPEITIPVEIPAPWKPLLDKITLNYEPIYHSTIVGKLKKIAKVK